MKLAVAFDHRGVHLREAVFEALEGHELIDVDGNRFLDYVCSWGPLIHGHAHPDVLAAIAEQTGIHERATLYSSTEFKKVRLLYFTDDFKNWESRHITIRDRLPD